MRFVNDDRFENRCNAVHVLPQIIRNAVRHGDPIALFNILVRGLALFGQVLILEHQQQVFGRMGKEGRDGTGFVLAGMVKEEPHFHLQIVAIAEDKTVAFEGPGLFGLQPVNFPWVDAGLEQGFQPLGEDGIVGTNNECGFFGSILRQGHGVVEEAGASRLDRWF